MTGELQQQPAKRYALCDFRLRREIPSQRTHCVDITRFILENCNKERRNRPYVFKLKPDAAAGTAQKYELLPQLLSRSCRAA
jgi:hypothetical protein